MDDRQAGVCNSVLCSCLKLRERRVETDIYCLIVLPTNENRHGGLRVAIRARCYSPRAGDVEGRISPFSGRVVCGETAT